MVEVLRTPEGKVVTVNLFLEAVALLRMAEEDLDIRDDGDAGETQRRIQEFLRAYDQTTEAGTAEPQA